ncbi:MAG TPA: sulfite exporter TauE/SafE family protein [Burkholderiaceae bacterium]|nr:sulfite exporter TauE/SafE family protein [Burkholderiaceae bacterium]
MLLVSFLGALIGLVMGMTGAGGGILAVPALVAGLGLTMTAAVPISLMAVGVSALVGALDGLSKKIVRYRAAALMAVLGSLMSHAGIALAHVLPEAVLMTLFALVMLLAAWRMAHKGHGATSVAMAESTKNCMLNPHTGKLRWTPLCAATLASIGATTGLFAGLLGVGGGFIVVPAFKRFTNVDMHSIVATSLTVIALISIGTVASLLARGTHISTTGWVFVAAAVVGMIAGRSIAAHMPARLLQCVFSGIAVVVAIILLCKTYLPGLLA